MRNNKPGVIPKRFESAIEISSDTSSERKAGRQWDENRFIVYPKLRTEAEVPFISGQTLSTQLLADTLGRTVITGKRLMNDKVTTLYSIPSDSLYKLLMQESDNFVAEQLLLLCASQLADSLDTDIALRFLRAELSDLPDTFRIVDGSGLSRYNLVTPRTMVALWQKIRSLTTDARLFSILPAGGVSGTIRNSYRGEKPFVFAKTGTLTGVHCLSGMIFTKSNRMLIFAYMNTNYTVPLREVRSSMEELLFKIRNNY
jgi:D-alanyl-D-alanine carboxypeptidase/D-alanyl-D-alanine-endopeptidase (penicillin-binding protein 4)